jgi:hypothetical protein
MIITHYLCRREVKLSNSYRPSLSLHVIHQVLPHPAQAYAALCCPTLPWLALLQPALSTVRAAAQWPQAAPPWPPYVFPRSLV